MLIPAAPCQRMADAVAGTWFWMGKWMSTGPLTFFPLIPSVAPVLDQLGLRRYSLCLSQFGRVVGHLQIGDCSQTSPHSSPGYRQYLSSQSRNCELSLGQH